MQIIQLTELDIKIMRAQIMLENGIPIVVGWGKRLPEDSTIECPDDYSPEKYNFINGNFIIKEDYVEPTVEEFQP